MTNLIEVKSIEGITFWVNINDVSYIKVTKSPDRPEENLYEITFASNYYSSFFVPESGASELIGFLEWIKNEREN